jgi:hypothetical protein
MICKQKFWDKSYQQNLKEKNYTDILDGNFTQRNHQNVLEQFF